MPYRDRAHRASCFVISITPFAEDGSLDEAGVPRPYAAAWRLAASVCMSAAAASGEGYTLSREENRKIFAIAVKS